MSITIAEGMALFRAGKSVLGGVRQAFKNRPGGENAQQLQAFRTALEQRLASSSGVAAPANAAATAPTQTPNQRRISESLAALERALGKTFSDQPMDLSKPAVLQLDATGIAVTNGHLDGAHLEALFNERPDLQQLVHRIDIALRAEAGPNANVKRATTLNIGANGITAALQPL